eukprot:CAMPEP_0181428358 /NCGR_PEP_ID=MMETSP1110-20121109/16638_1 /TAXON_ID=174948 /ORGANISM="Symbiodinium sp., Strain CCMP421" /LENGTH=96 /DNA_ID=CAMNT_0023551583 /DNA_START=646 /DNA_END=933 /DNA_ORIENTATION=+
MGTFAFALTDLLLSDAASESFLDRGVDDAVLPVTARLRGPSSHAKRLIGAACVSSSAWPNSCAASPLKASVTAGLMHTSWKGSSSQLMRADGSSVS